MHGVFFRSLFRGILLEDDPSAGGGDGGKGGGKGDPKYVTEDQLNRAISAKLTDFGKKFEAKVESLTTGITTKVEELFAGLKDSLPKPPEPKGGDKGGGGGLSEEAIANHPLFKGLRKQVETLTGKLEASDAEKAELAAKQKSSRLRDAAKEQLLKNGVGEATIKQALNHLINGEGRIKYADDGETITFHDEDGAEFDLKTGVKAWVKTDEAKIYLPPRGTKGSGHQPGQGGSGGKSGQQGPRLGSRLADVFYDGNAEAMAEIEDE